MEYILELYKHNMGKWEQVPGTLWSRYVMSEDEKVAYLSDVAADKVPWFKRPGEPMAPDWTHAHKPPEPAPLKKTPPGVSAPCTDPPNGH